MQLCLLAIWCPAGLKLFRIAFFINAALETLAACSF